MHRHRFLWITAILVAGIGTAVLENNPVAADETSLATLLQQFHQYTGAELVFRRDDLPEGRYHDVLKPLAESERERSVALCLEEARFYPPGYFRRIGLKSIGVFAACASKTTSFQSRPYDKQLGGYRYYGVYNGRDAIAIAFYNDGQLAMTLHHEVFHHVDSTVDSDTAAWQLSSDDALYFAAISGRKPYPAPSIEPSDLKRLRNKCIGITLKDAVSEYAAKNAREDQAETARHMMSMLPNALVQTIDQPDLPGSQRILHILQQYEQAAADGPSFDWFVDVALGRATQDSQPPSAQELIASLEKSSNDENRFAHDKIDTPSARQWMADAVRVGVDDLTPEQADAVLRRAADITVWLIRQRIRPSGSYKRFDIHGEEDASGANHTLRHDLHTWGRDAARIAAIANHLEPKTNAASRKAVVRALTTNLRITAKYFVFINTSFSMTDRTSQVFDQARAVFVDSLRKVDANSADAFVGQSWQAISVQPIDES